MPDGCPGCFRKLAVFLSLKLVGETCRAPPYLRSNELERGLCCWLFGFFGAETSLSSWDSCLYNLDAFCFLLTLLRSSVGSFFHSSTSGSSLFFSATACHCFALIFYLKVSTSSHELSQSWRVLSFYWVDALPYHSCPIGVQLGLLYRLKRCPFKAFCIVKILNCPILSCIGIMCGLSATKKH